MYTKQLLRSFAVGAYCPMVRRVADRRAVTNINFPETTQEKGVGERGKRGAGGKPVGGGAFPSLGFEIPAPEGLSPR